MSDLKYLDFDLTIEPSGQGYVARVVHSPVGTASSEFTTSFTDLEIENFLLRVGRSRHAVRRIESPEMAAAKAFGGKLFNEVFAGDVRGCLRSSLDEAGRQGVGLRVRLRLDGVPALADLPWEFLYNSGMNRFLGLSVETPLVRYVDLPERIRPLSVTPPLRVLMMISSPTDYPKLDVDREAAKMGEALADLESRGLVVVERQEVATLAELQKRLRQGQYHIFHFVGHGGFDDQAQDGLLILEDQEERGRRVSAQFLGTLLHDHRPLRLAVLNACEGARSSRTDPFAGTAQALVQQGIPAVIAMQFEVTDEAAICFTREFYAAVAVGYPVDAALAEARKAIFAEVSEIEWGTPVLYMRAPDGCIFEVQKVSEQDRREHHIASLLTAARTADGSGDEPTAILRLKEVLKLAPEHATAQTRLEELTRQQELYKTARAAYDGRRWREALDSLQKLDPTYQDVAALIAGAEAGIAKASGEETKKKRAADLRQAAAAASSEERWNDAVEAWQRLQALEPEDKEARDRLNESRRQRDLATLYSRGRAYYERRRWRDALAELHQVQQVTGNYKDVSFLIASIERELNRLADEERAAARARNTEVVREPVAARVTNAPPPAAAQKPQSRAGWFVAGGALGAVVVLGVLAIIVAIAIVSYQNDQGTDTSDDTSVDSSTPPEPERLVPPVPDSGSGAPSAPPPEYRAPAPAVVTPAIRDQLKLAILQGDNAEIEAYRTLNERPLYASYAGEVLQTHLASLQALRANGVLMANTLHNQVFHSFAISPDGQTAEVELTERWSTNFHSVTQAGQPCVSHWHEHDVPQTLVLQFNGQRWMIVESRQDNPDPQPAECH